MGTAKIFDAFSEPASIHVAMSAQRLGDRESVRRRWYFNRAQVPQRVAILGEGATVEAREVFRFFWLGTHALRLSQLSLTVRDSVCQK